MNAPNCEKDSLQGQFFLVQKPPQILGGLGFFRHPLLCLEWDTWDGGSASTPDIRALGYKELWYLVWVPLLCRCLGQGHCIVPKLQCIAIYSTRTVMIIFLLSSCITVSFYHCYWESPHFTMHMIRYTCCCCGQYFPIVVFGKWLLWDYWEQSAAGPIL